jgi:hypothetical protein
MTSPLTAQILNNNGKRARQDESESLAAELMASTGDEEDLENESGDTTLLLASSHSPAPEQDHELEQSSEVTTPEPTSGHMQPTHRHHRISDRRPPCYTSPESSLPPWKFVSPRETNPAARPPSAMAHRAHTPIPQTALEHEGTPLPDTANVLVSYDQHGDTTYTSQPTEQIELDPNNPVNAEVLSFTDKLPMAGVYLFNADHRKVVREQVAMVKAYHQDGVMQAQIAYQREREGRLNRVAGQ